MAFKAEHCQAWIEAQAPGEQLVSHLVTGTGQSGGGPQVGMKSGITFNGPQALAELAQRLGLDEADKVGLFQEATFLALTHQRVFYGSRSFFRDRPKELLHVAPASGLTVHWVDDDRGSGNTFRHLLVDFGDGAWRLERVGLTALKKDMGKRSNVHHFFEVLGDRARPLAV